MKKVIILATIAAIFSAVIFIFGSCTVNGNNTVSQPTAETQTVNVSFVLNREIVYSASVEQGGKVTEPDLTDLDEGAFIVWTYNGSIFDFDKPIKCDTVLTATLSKKFSINFKADGKTIKKCEYSYYDRTVKEPQVPDKKGYSGNWESYETAGGNMTVNAIYTPVVYSIDYFMDGTVAQSITCTIENYDKLIPAVPDRIGYAGNWTYEQISDTRFKAQAEYAPKVYTANFYVDEKLVKSIKTAFNEELMLPEIPEKKYYESKWSDRLEVGEIYEYRAEYTPIEYTVRFVAGDRLVATKVYTVTDKSVTPPPVPEKLHYDGKWESYSLNFEDITVNADYSPKKYAVEFVADGNIVDTKYYTVLSTDITPPLLPEKDGYTGTWASFELCGGNVTVQAEYTAIKYLAQFIADGVTVKEAVYTVENTDIEIPEVPQKNGYTGVWPDFTLGIGGAVINAEYGSIRYTVTFIADEKVIAVKTYSAENKTVIPPAVPDKDGYSGQWQVFTLDCDNVVVEAEYSATLYTASFIADGVTVKEAVYTVENTDIEIPEVPQKNGYTGVWQDFTLDIGGAVINAEYTPIQYTVTFVADEKVIAVKTYTVEDKSVIPPAVPDKEGFSGQWESFTPDCGDIVVNAEYFIAYYTATFIADGEVVAEIMYDADGGEVTPPPVPDKFGFDGKWQNYYLSGNVTVYAEYTAILYKVSFVADGELICTEYYTVEDNKITEPSVPLKNGYTGVWESYELTGGDITVNAEHTAIIYKVNFVVGQEVISTACYTVENKDIAVPAVPEKDGYTGAWKRYELTGGDKTVTAEYTAILYKVSFTVGEEVISTAYYTVENKDIAAPAVPERDGYTGAWESYELTHGDITVNAEYTIETYNVYFISDGKIIAQTEYTVLNKNITVPDAPLKQGYESRWEDFILTYGDVTVNAIFTPIEGTDGLIYTLDGEGYTVTGYRGDDLKIIIPSFHEGLPVTKISDDAFSCLDKNTYTFEEITICENVQIIGANAFSNCISLNRVNLPQSLTAIKQSAFASCTNLENIVLPDNVTLIEEGAFTESGLKSVTLPKNLTFINSNTFSFCRSLREIVIPDRVTEISFVAFMGCSSLERVVFGEGLKTIGQYAFMNCTKLARAEFKDDDGWTLIKRNGDIDVSAQFTDPAAAATVISYYYDCEFQKK